MNERNRIFAVLALGFVLLGVSLTMQGVVWPSVADSFDRPLSNLGWVTLCFGSGYTLSTLASGRLARRPGVGATLLAAAATGILGLVTVASSPSFGVFLAGALLLGLAGGLLDAATNTYVAIERGAREMGLIHGAVGVGAIIGPLLVTALLEAGVDWRSAFLLVAALQAAYGIPLWLKVHGLHVSPRSSERSVPVGWSSPVVRWSVGVFVVYAGMATSAGVWAFTYLTEERGFSEGGGGVVIAAYFAGFTASRFLLGLIGDRIPPDTVLRWSAIATSAVLALFWAGPADWVVVAALVAAGFGHGPIFPLEILLTPRRLGQEATARVVGYEIAGANVGGAAIPGVVGLAVGAAGLDIIPPLLFGNSVLVVLAVERLRAISASSAGGSVIDRAAEQR